MEPANAAAIPSAYRTPDFIGVDCCTWCWPCTTALTSPHTWAELDRSPAYGGAVALPSPSFAASALGMLGYFASAPGYGMSYYQQLKSHGAKQFDAPPTP